MRTKFTSITLVSCFVCTTLSCFSAGVDRIDVEPGKYGYFFRGGDQGQWYDGWGYHTQGIDRFQGGDHFQSHIPADGSRRWVAHTFTARTITGDIRGAFLDRDLFDASIAENRFFDAWSMGAETEQGILWKRIAFSQSKKHIKQLIGASVFEGNVEKLREARILAASFPAAPQAELNAFIASEEAAARDTLARLTPEQAARTAALRSVADRLFG
jgi:hypothetical protein